MWPLWRLPLFYLRAAFSAVIGQFLLLEETAYTFAFGLVLHGVHAGVDDGAGGCDEEGSRVWGGNILFPGQIFPFVHIPAGD